MDSDPNAPDTLDDRSPAKSGDGKRERYNTEYIVDNFTRQERRNRMIVAGVAGALVLALGLGMLLHRKAPDADRAAQTAGDTPPEASAPPPAAPPPK